MDTLRAKQRLPNQQRQHFRSCLAVKRHTAVIAILHSVLLLKGFGSCFSAICVTWAETPKIKNFIENVVYRFNNEQEELGHALEQQLTKKCTEELHSSPSFKCIENEPSPTSCNNLPTNQTQTSVSNLPINQIENDPSNKENNESNEINSFQAPLPVEELRVDFSKIENDKNVETDINISNSNSISIDSQNEPGAESKADAIPNDIVERPLPPPSPTKINRIKAVPKFSESDGGRHHGRTRNISVCSVTTLNDGALDNVASNKEVFPPVQKKISRSEQSKKLAEARREFQKRFGENCPDKQKLKMIDLIFYNPITNPMTDQTEKEERLSTKFNNEKEEPQKDKEQEVDDPLENPKNTANDESSEKDKDNEAEDDEVPVPQIKIGPNGEIILDEQSLVIENKDVQKQRNDIQMSDVIDGDCKTSYGIFKRYPRAKDWNHKETLRFYKALNVIGSDFSMMAELFPTRNRRELKAKFKKEEKINGNLISKALTIPCCYNYNQLKQDFWAEQEEEKELLRIAQEEANVKQQRIQKKKEKKIKRDARDKFRSKPMILDSGSSEDEDQRIKATQKGEKIAKDIQRQRKVEEDVNQDILKEDKTKENCSDIDDEFAENSIIETKSALCQKEKYEKENKKPLASKNSKKIKISQHDEKDIGQDKRVSSGEEGVDMVESEITNNVNYNYVTQSNSDNDDKQKESNIESKFVKLKKRPRFRPYVASKRTKNLCIDQKSSANNQENNFDSGNIDNEDEWLNVVRNSDKIVNGMQRPPKDKSSKVGNANQYISKDDKIEENFSDIDDEFVENSKKGMTPSANHKEKDEKEHKEQTKKEKCKIGQDKRMTSEDVVLDPEITHDVKPNKPTQSHFDNYVLINEIKETNGDSKNVKQELGLKRKQRFKPNVQSKRSKKPPVDQESDANSHKVNGESDSDSQPDESIKKAFLSDEYLVEESESEEEATMPILLPTRFGRLPKSRNVEQAQLVSMPPPGPPGLMQMRNRRSSSMSSTISNESSLENAVPGSIMVVTEEGLDGKPVYKSYMITPDRTLTPLNVESDVIAKVIDYKSDKVPDSDCEEDSGIAACEPEATNITIPANNGHSEGEALELTIQSVSANTENNFITKKVNYTVLQTKNGVPVGDNKSFSIQIVDEGNSESDVLNLD